MPHNLKKYQQEVWHLISQFQDCNIIYVPRMRKVVADALENVVSRLSLIYMSLMMTSRLHFIENVDVLKYATIDKDDHEKVLQYVARMNKENPISKGVVSLEKLYELHNHFRGPINAKNHISMLSHEQINIGMEKDSNFINLDTCCTPQEREDFIHLFK